LAGASAAPHRVFEFVSAAGSACARARDEKQTHLLCQFGA
jgi:hypothetical protein